MTASPGGWLCLFTPPSKRSLLPRIFDECEYLSKKREDFYLMITLSEPGFGNRVSKRRFHRLLGVQSVVQSSHY